MIKLRRLIPGWIILNFFMLTSAYADDLVFTQLTSTQNQPAIHPANLVSLETVDGIDNIGSALTKITISRPGYYFVMAVGQVGTVKPNAPTDGYIDLWLIKNGVSVSNSGSRKTVGASQTSTITTQTILQLNAGDTVSVAFSASDPAFGLVSIPAANLEPAISSMAFTIYKL